MIKMKSFAIILVIWLKASMILARAGTTPIKDPPNIVIIMADDMVNKRNFFLTKVLTNIRNSYCLTSME